MASSMKRRVAGVIAAGTVGLSSWIVGSASPVQAANACQHYDHDHYHFPYAHYDHWDYHGYKTVGHDHIHVYHNHNHGNYYEAQC